MYSYCNNGLAPCYKMFMDGNVQLLLQRPCPLLLDVYGWKCTVTVITALPLAIRCLWMEMYSYCYNGLAPCYKMFMDGNVQLLL